MSDSRSPVVVVGAGYCGALAAVQLLRADDKVQVVLVERSACFARGLAYRDHDDNLLLNVPAGNMSAVADAPDHFVAWCQAIDPALHAASFVSRRLYGDYLQQLLADAERSAGGRLERVTGEAVAVAPVAGGYEVMLADGRRLAAAAVVLALGHFAPRDPLPAPGLAAWGAHAASPWNLASLDSLPRDRPVLVLGTGHSAVDALFRLTASTAARPVVMVSRRGLLPNGHRRPPATPPSRELPGWLTGVAPTVRALTRALRAEVARHQAAGGDWRDVLNDLRPHTPALWQQLPVAERRRFLARSVAWWDVHRHRLAPTAHQRLQSLLDGGRAECVAARIVSVTPANGGVDVTWRRRGQTTTEVRRFGGVVNAAGPNLDLATIDSPLLHQLRRCGLLRADPAGLGLQTDEQRRVVARHGRPVPGLFYLGPMLKARHWEAIAVPELRQHAQALAADVLAAVRLAVPAADHALAA